MRAGPVRRTDHSRIVLPGDCCELYMLSRDGITDFQPLDPNDPRRNDKAVQDTRRRMCHELTYAVSSLYKTAKFLGIAERIRRDLKRDLLMPGSRERDAMVALIEGVRKGCKERGRASSSNNRSPLGR